MGGVRACLSCFSEFLPGLHKLSCQLYGLINTTSVVMEAKYEELEFGR